METRSWTDSPMGRDGERVMAGYRDGEFPRWPASSDYSFSLPPSGSLMSDSMSLRLDQGMPHHSSGLISYLSFLQTDQPLIRGWVN